MNLFLFFIVYGMKDKILVDGAIAADLNDVEDLATVETAGEGNDEFGPLGQKDVSTVFARRLSYASVTSDASVNSLQYVRTVSIT